MDEHRKIDDGQLEREGDFSRISYSRPELKVYGTIAALTHAVGNAGMVTDGGSMGKTKTS